MDNVILFPVPISDLEALLRRIVREEIVHANPGQPDQSTGPLLDRNQLAEKLNCSTKTIANWSAKGKIPYMLVGTVERYDLAQVRAALTKTKSKK